MADENAGMACPQCGNPNLDVDAANNVVYCKNCGFAVQVDPQTGNVTPLSQGGQPGAAPAVYASHDVFGLDPLTFLLAGTALLLLLYFLNVFTDITIYAILQTLVLLAWWMRK